MFGEQLSATMKSVAGRVGGDVEPLIAPQTRAFELGEQLDQIRRKYGGLRLR